MNDHRDYIENTHNDDFKSFSPKEIEQFGEDLNNPDTDIELKKKALGVLAHCGDLQSYNILKAYAAKPDNGLELWSELALGECALFLHADICGDDCEDGVEFVFTGVGKHNNMLRIYFVVLPEEGKFLEDWQHDIIRKEMSWLAQDIGCEEIEWFDCKPHYVGLSMLQPLDVSITQFINPAIAACNVFGNFLIPEYYAGTGIPNADEIEKIINIVYHGGNDDDMNDMDISAY